MWRTVTRVVGSGPTTAASNAAMCRMCTTTPALKAPTTSARMSCSCASSEVHTSPNSGMQQHWEIDDWVFAGDDVESLDYLVFGTAPTQQDVEDATAELHHALQIGLLMRRSTSTNSLESVAQNTDASEVNSLYRVSHPTSDGGDWKEPVPWELPSSSSSNEIVGAPGYGNMLEAFHQFQHNPQVQKMVVSLATDKNVWESVLANEQIKEFRQKLRESTGLIENGSERELTVDDVQKALNNDTNLFSHMFWHTKKAFSQFIATLQELIRGIFDVTEETLKVTDDDEAFFERTVRSTMMLSVLVMSLVVFKRSAAHIS